MSIPKPHFLCVPGPFSTRSRHWRYHHHRQFPSIVYFSPPQRHSGLIMVQWHPWHGTRRYESIPGRPQHGWWRTRDSWSHRITLPCLAVYNWAQLYDKAICRATACTLTHTEVFISVCVGRACYILSLSSLFIKVTNRNILWGQMFWFVELRATTPTFLSVLLERFGVTSACYTPASTRSVFIYLLQSSLILHLNGDLMILFYRYSSISIFASYVYAGWRTTAFIHTHAHTSTLFFLWPETPDIACCLFHWPCVSGLF